MYALGVEALTLGVRSSNDLIRTLTGLLERQLCFLTRFALERLNCAIEPNEHRRGSAGASGERPRARGKQLRRLLVLELRGEHGDLFRQRLLPCLESRNAFTLLE